MTHAAGTSTSRAATSCVSQLYCTATPFGTTPLPCTNGVAPAVATLCSGARHNIMMRHTTTTSTRTPRHLSTSPNCRPTTTPRRICFQPLFIVDHSRQPQERPPPHVAQSHRGFGKLSGRSKNSSISSNVHQWVQRQMADRYVKRAQNESYRTRAAYKLKQIDSRFGIFRKGQKILDLGCYAGGWSQVALERTVLADDADEEARRHAQVIGVDLLHIDPLDDQGHVFIQGDVTKADTLEKILRATNGEKVDVVLSDMCPSLTGVKQDDHLDSAELCLAAGEMMERVLRLDGSFVVKMMYGPETTNFKMYLRSRFKTVHSFKPPASRDESREMFFVCSKFVGRESIAAAVQTLPGYQPDKLKYNSMY
ncbi:unnamed protein product [Amoebophrya sp. A120]|nr:unnamed protein product [Amoebophrya sp. A120]|eukprot:GSA120T00001498001.1